MRENFNDLRWLLWQINRVLAEEEAGSFADTLFASYGTTFDEIQTLETVYDGWETVKSIVGRTIQPLRLQQFSNRVAKRKLPLAAQPRGYYYYKGI